MGYSTFAKYYDAAMGDRTQDVSYLQELVRKHKPDGKKLLDLGCGTGEILKSFADKMECTGVDASPEMLALAKAKVPNANIVQGDITVLNLKQQFDVVLCVFDTINHLLDRGQWKQVFVSARQHLSPDGLFVFDFNTLHKLNKFADGDMQGHEFGGNYFMTDVTRQENNVFDWCIKVFEKEPSNEFLLHEEHVQETSFATADIVEMLESVFFGYLETTDPYLGEVTEQSNRIVCICK